MGKSKKPSPEGGGKTAGKMEEDRGTGAGHGNGAAEAAATKTVAEQETEDVQSKERTTSSKEAKGVGRNVWKGSEVTRALFQSVETSRANASKHSDEKTYAAEYACARAPCNVHAPGKQREPTALERRTLWLWRNGTLHLEHPPHFVKAIHTVRQRARDWDIQRKYKFFRLFLMPHPGFRMRPTGTKFHFFMTMLGMNEENKVTDSMAVKLISSVYTIKCSPESQLIEFLFVRPEERDRWAGKTIKLPGGEVTLQATDSFAVEDQSIGYNGAAMSLFFQLRLLGAENQEARDILAVAEHMSEDIEILDYRLEPATGNKILDDHVWVFTLATHHGPAGLAKIREVQVTQGAKTYKLGLHQPRLAVYPPCSHCLDDWHPRQKCPFKAATEEAMAKREEKRLNKVLIINLDETSKLPLGTKPQSEEEYFKQMANDNARLEPEAFKAKTAEATAAEAALAAALEASNAEAKKQATEKEAYLALQANKEDSMNALKDEKPATAEKQGNGRGKEPKATGKPVGRQGKTKQKAKQELDSEKDSAPAETATTDSEMESGKTGGLGNTVTGGAAVGPTGVTKEPDDGGGGSSTMRGDDNNNAAVHGVDSSSKGAEQRSDSGSTTGAEDRAEDQHSRGTDQQGDLDDDEDAKQDIGCSRRVDNGMTNGVTKEGRADVPASNSGKQEGEGEQDESAKTSAAADGGKGDGTRTEEKKEVDTMDIDLEDARAEQQIDSPEPTNLPGDRRLSDTRSGKRAAKRRMVKQAKKAAETAKEMAAAFLENCRKNFESKEPQETGPDEKKNGNKRVRANTKTADPTRTADSETRPPTRQARVATVQHCVTDAETLAGYYEVAKTRRKQKQLSLSGFCKPIDTIDENGEPRLIYTKELGGDAEDDFEIGPMSVEDITKQAQRDSRADSGSQQDAITNRIRFAELKSNLNLREISTPGTGSCLAYAIHAARTAQHVQDTILTRHRVAEEEATSYRQQLALHGHDVIDDFLNNGTCTVEEIARHHLRGGEATNASREAIKTFLLEDGAQPVCSTIPRQYWSSAMHLKLTSNYTKEPVFCVDVLHRFKEYREHEVFVQKYVPSLTANAVRVELPTVAETLRQWEVYAAHKVLPIILVLHHYFDEDGAITGHYTALRPDQKYYRKWSGNQTRQRAMLERLKVVNAIIEGREHEQPLVHQFPTPASTWQSPDVASEYEPSKDVQMDETREPNMGGAGVEGKEEEVLNVHTAAGFQEAEKAKQQTDEPSAASKQHRPGLSLEISLALDSTPSSVFSETMSQRCTELQSMSTGSPATPLSAEDHTSLLLAISKRKKIDGDSPMVRVLQQAERANRTHYHVWHKKQLQERTAVAESVASCVSLDEALEQLRDSPIFLIHMIRALPHTHFLLAMIIDKDLCRFGQALVGIGRMQMLHRFVQGERMRSDAGNVFCLEWMMAIASAGLGAAQLADDEARWERLGNMCKFKLQPRRPPQLEPEDWYRLMVFAVALPEFLPAEFRNAPIPQVCDAIMTYLTVASRSEDVRLVAKGLKEEEWYAIEALFPSNMAESLSTPAPRRGSAPTTPQAASSPEEQPAGPNRS